MLWGVTLTGADDSVDPERLRELSVQFPFVEFGILVGSSAACQRFPSRAWFQRLAEVYWPYRAPKLALHVCGRPLRNLLAGGSPEFGVPVDLEIFRRVQLNFHGTQLSPEQVAHLCLLPADFDDREVIVQLDGVNDEVLERFLNFRVRSSGLYDRSHGRGVLPDSWPAPNPNRHIGYAGGLGPDNVAAELRKLYEVTKGQRFWIDMETKLFSNNGQQFDLRFCRAVLEECQPFVGKEWRHKPVSS